MLPSEITRPSQIILNEGKKRNVSLFCGYYYSQDYDVWFLKNPNSDAGVVMRWDGEFFGYWQGEDEDDMCEILKESYPDMTHISL